jgi:hypothetical protein
MDSVIAQPRAAVAERPRAKSGLVSTVLAFVEQNGTLVMLFSAAVYLFVANLPSGVQSDGWLALLAGREIVQHGLPSHDTLTVWAEGRRWIDQQWLAQVALYGLQRLGGYRLVMLFHAALALGGFGAACAIARRRGASALSVTWISSSRTAAAVRAGSSTSSRSSSCGPTFTARSWWELFWRRRTAS